MSDSVLALVVMLSLVAGALVWVPFLHVCRRLHRGLFRRTLPVLGVGLLLAVGGAASGQFTVLNSITTIAGNGSLAFSGDGGQAVAASLHGPIGIAIDKSGNLYFSDTLNERVRKVAPSGVITTVAGNGTAGFSGDSGPATAAMLNHPRGLAFDATGNLYVADASNNRIRKITPDGIISTIAGTGALNDTGDNGPATSAAINPQELAFDATGNLYVACDFVVRKISPLGIITTFAGGATSSFGGDGGPATSATFSSTDGVAVDVAGNVYISSAFDARVREVTIADGKIKTIAGNGSGNSGGDGGLATAATLTPRGMFFDLSGNLFIVDTDGGYGTYVREILAANKTIISVAGSAANGFSGDGNLATAAQFTTPFDLTVDGSGNIYVADYANNRIRAVGPIFIPPTVVTSSAAKQYYYLQTTANESITSVTAPASLGNKQEYVIGAVTGCTVDGTTINAAGSICSVPVTFTPAYPGQRPIPLQAVTSAGTMNFPLNGLASAPLAALTPGIATTLAGVGIAGDTGDGGPAASARVGNPFVATDGVGNVYFADSSYQVVRRIDALTGVITKVAGTGVTGYSGDGGPALQATFGDVQAVTVDSSGNLYIADSVDCVVRKITAATGIITTVAGNSTIGYSGVGGPALNAQICANSITVDAAGNLYLTTGRNYAGTTGSWVLKVTASTGLLSVVAGTGVVGYSGDGGPATAATLNNVDGVALDSANNIYIADGANNVIRKVNAVTGIITTIAGNGGSGYTGDGGPATSATMEIPRGIVVDSAGDVYFTDCCTYTVRKVDAATGIIRTVAGGGGSTTDGVPATTQGYSYLDSVALDGAGNIYFGDFGARLHKVDVSRTTLTYPTSTAVGSLDTTDNPQTAILSDVGNQTLNSYAGNGSISASWSIDGSSTCAPLTALTVGTSCSLPVDFQPTVPGAPLMGTLTLLDTSLNAQPATQTITLTGTATGSGSLSISPISQTFGSTVQGTASAALTSTITNTTSQAVYLSSGSLTDSTDFTESDNCSGLVAANTGSCTVTFTFTPKSSGPLSSTYSIHDLNNPNSPLTVALSGTATAPPAVLSVTPNPVAFPSTTVNTTSSGVIVTLTNTGGSNLQLQTTIATIGGADSPGFSLIGSACGYTLAPNASCTLTLAFSPTAARTYNATLTIPSNDPNSPAMVTLTGTGLAALVPQAAIGPNALSFITVVNTAAYNQSVTLSNPGTGTLNISSIAIGGANASSFSVVTSTCGATLAAGSSCTITVGFPIIVAGTYAATLTVTDNASPTTQTVTLTGVVNGTPQAALTPASYSFGSVTTGTAPATQSFTLSNAGTAALSITSIGLTGANAGSFSIASNSCGASLAAGSTCSVAVSFAPASAGSLSASLSVVDALGTQSAGLSGTGVSPTPADFTLVATPAAQSSYLGTTVTYQLSLAPVSANNPYTLAINLSARGLPSGATVAFTPASVTPGAAAVGSSMTITIPALQGSNREAPRDGGGRAPTIFSATLLLATLLRGNRRLRSRLSSARIMLVLLFLGGVTTALTGCGAGTGFAIPQSTSTITISGTSGTLVHSATVTLTLK